MTLSQGTHDGNPRFWISNIRIKERITYRILGKLRNLKEVKVIKRDQIRSGITRYRRNLEVPYISNEIFKSKTKEEIKRSNTVGYN